VGKASAYTPPAQTKRLLEERLPAIKRFRNFEAIFPSLDKSKSRRDFRAKTRTEARPIHRSRSRHARARQPDGVASESDPSAALTVRESGRNRTDVPNLNAI